MKTQMKNNHQYKFFQLSIWILCLASFGANVWFTFMSFIESETIQSVASKLPLDKVNFPSFAICLKKPFRNDSKLMLTLDDYDANAYDPRELNVTMDSNYSSYSFFKNAGTTFKEEILRTRVNGMCLYYEMEEKVIS